MIWITDRTHVRAAVIKKKEEKKVINQSELTEVNRALGQALLNYSMLSILTVLPKYLRTSFSPARRISSSTKLKKAQPPGNESVWTDFSGQFHTQGKEVCGSSHTIQQKHDRGSMDSVKLAHCCLIELPAKLFLLFKILGLCFGVLSRFV